MTTITDVDLDREMTAALRALDIDRFEQLAAEADRRREESQQRLKRVDALAAAAAWYARHGVAVFPCAPRGKRPICRRGFQDATCDPEQVRRWWTDTPAANIATPTGRWADVVDIDGPNGHASVTNLQQRGLLPEPLALVSTPGDDDHDRPPGMHYLIPPTGDGNGTRVAPGMDFRGDGGYTLLPPSHGPNGKQYRWLTEFPASAVAGEAR